MIASPFLLILGVAVLGIALRSFEHAVAQKLGTLAIFAASFLTGWLLMGSLWAGFACAALWLFLPWLELLTRVRGLRLPNEKNLRTRTPPSAEAFPALEDLSAELEEEKFTYVSDAGWDWQDQDQFFRLYYREHDRTQASICMIEQQSLAFYYLSICSRGADGTTWITWNYPFAYSLKLPPQTRVNRVRADDSFFALLEAHREFLQENKIATDQLAELDEEQIMLEIQNDLRRQIEFNLAGGMLTRADESHVRYSWRGLLHIWLQFLRDLVRLS